MTQPAGTNNNTNPDAIYTQIQKTAGFYPPLVYDLLTRFSSLTTLADPLSQEFLPTTDVLPQATFNTLPFVIGFIPPSSPVTGRLVSREASVHSGGQGPTLPQGTYSQGLNPGPNGPSPTSLSAAGAAFIAAHEGFRGQIYNDDAGNPTIGFGHLIRPGEDFSGGLTYAQGQALLQQDAQGIANYVSKHVTVPVTQNQFDALVSYTFSTGNLTSSQGQKILGPLNQGDYQGAAQGWATAAVYNNAGFVDPGLVAIRPNEINLFNTPDGQTYTYKAGAQVLTGDVGNPNGWNQQGGSGLAQTASTRTTRRRTRASTHRHRARRSSTSSRPRSRTSRHASNKWRRRLRCDSW